MEKNRSDYLKHTPRGIIKWAPFKSLPEFTTKLKEQNETPNKESKRNSNGKN